MVPSWLGSHNIVVFLPFAGCEVVNTEDLVLAFGVPATIGVELSVADEDAVTATANRGWRISALLLVLLPGFRVDVETVDVGIRTSVVAETAMTAVDEDLTFSVAVAAVGARRGSSNHGLLVGIDLFVASYTGPFDFAALSIEPPAVVEASRRGSVTSVDEEALRLETGLGWIDRNMLGSGNWLLARDFFLRPGRLGCNSKLAFCLKEAANMKFK